MRLVPRSLFGRLVVAVLSVLVVAQLASLGLHMHERGELLLQASGLRAAQRIADIVKLFETVDPRDRTHIAKVLSAPPTRVTVSQSSPAEAGDSNEGPRAALFAALLRRFLGEERPLRVQVSESASATNSISSMA